MPEEIVIKKGALLNSAHIGILAILKMLGQKLDATKEVDAVLEEEVVEKGRRVTVRFLDQIRTHILRSLYSVNCVLI